MTAAKSPPKGPEKIPKKSHEEEYIEAAILHRQLLEAGNVRGSNAAFDRLIHAIKEIRKSADRGRSFLLPLLMHTDENVRLCSATHLLPLEEKIAFAELKRLATSATMWPVQSSAEITVDEWRKGTLNID